MTVAELSPLELYALIITAFVIVGLGLLGAREWPNLETKREKFMMAGGAFALFGLPTIIGLRLLAFH